MKGDTATTTTTTTSSDNSTTHGRYQFIIKKNCRNAAPDLENSPSVRREFIPAYSYVKGGKGSGRASLNISLISLHPLSVLNSSKSLISSLSSNSSSEESVRLRI
ncbi:hypothetical protein E2C01_087879 [Portunus trituberculatus]|uniref:Uncharacterized protein n=1 Tax=Portunus trituberculatus TaxID=210409 RepID=A0A5B7JEI8_PORTR|nr:hypothetical protein [Portunus trituberculatus]